MKRFHIDSKYEYCPNGNYWTEVSGIFDKEIYLFCDCNKCKGEVYKLKPFRVTKKINKESIKRFRDFQKLYEIRDKVNITNMDLVDKTLTSNK